MHGRNVNWNDAGVLETSVRAGERGPLIVLSGSAEFTNITQLIEVINPQLSGGTRQLVIDVSNAPAGTCATPSRATA